MTAVPDEEAGGGLRLDKWLWYARFFKTRSLATKVCAAGKVRLDGAPVSKAHQRLKPGDVLTFPQGRHIRVVRVLALAGRRGPAAEAQRLYEDLKPPEPGNRLPPRGAAGARERGPAGRRRGSGGPSSRSGATLRKAKGEG